MKEKNNIGIDVTVPKEKCGDRNCPFHGTLKVRGRVFIGEVISKDIHGTARIKWGRQLLIPKYERYEKRFSKISSHNPKCIDANVGDKVKVMECKPISKTKHFVIVQIIEK